MNNKSFGVTTNLDMNIDKSRYCNAHAHSICGPSTSCCPRNCSSTSNATSTNSGPLVDMLRSVQSLHRSRPQRPEHAHAVVAVCV